MKIERWAKGKQNCETQKTSTEMWVEDSPGDVSATCLGVAVDHAGLLTGQITQIATIIQRHFAARVTCVLCQRNYWQTIVHFNDHADTTREDVDKVLKMYTEEIEAANV